MQVLWCLEAAAPSAGRARPGILRGEKSSPLVLRPDTTISQCRRTPPNSTNPDHLYPQLYLLPSVVVRLIIAAVGGRLLRQDHGIVVILLRLNPS